MYLKDRRKRMFALIANKYKQKGKNIYPSKIDIVYSWAGIGESTSLYNYELQYSLRSCSKYVSWVNHIYILMNNNTVPPYWLNNKAKQWITIVNRCELFDDPKNTPTRNPHAIYTVCHKIPNLSNKFIYMDDDFFFSGRVGPEYFFDPATEYPIVKLEHNKQKIYTKEEDVAFPKYKYTSFSHQPIPLRKDFIKLFITKYPTYLQFIQTHKTRYDGHISEEIFMIYYQFLDELDLIIKKSNDTFYQIPCLKYSDDTYHFTHKFNKYLMNIIRPSIKCFNLNDEFSNDNKIRINQLKLIKKFYQTLYPDKPWFEK